MSKVITSPIEKFPGTVTLYDPVPYPAYIAWEKAVKEEGAVDDLTKQHALFKGVKEMVEQWDIPNYDINNPAATPRVPVIQLLSWLVVEIGKVINGDVNPN